MSDPSATFSGGKFNSSKSKSDIDWMIYQAKKLPGPGQYEIEKPAKYCQKNVSLRGPQSAEFACLL